MKKMLVMILMVMMMPVIACAQGTYSISELHEMYDGQRWQGEYYTARNETVVIDAPFLIPDVDAAPVIVVSAYPELNQSFHDSYTSPDKKLRWQTYADSARSARSAVTDAQGAKRTDRRRTDETRYEGQYPCRHFLLVPTSAVWNRKHRAAEHTPCAPRSRTRD